MSIESDLRKDGIEVTKKLDTLKVNSIARNVAVKLCETFSSFNLNQNDLFIKLSRLNMYIAKMPEGMAEANYFFKNHLFILMSILQKKILMNLQYMNVYITFKK